jgi:hypothetical protein
MNKQPIAYPFLPKKTKEEKEFFRPFSFLSAKRRS